MAKDQEQSKPRVRSHVFRILDNRFNEIYGVAWHSTTDSCWSQYIVFEAGAIEACQLSILMETMRRLLARLTPQKYHQVVYHDFVSV